MPPPHHAPAATAQPGTPSWWASRTPTPSAKRRGRPRRSFEHIVEEALRLVDEVGVADFRMRTLSERLTTSTATLYRHVSGKQELMAYVVDLVFAEMRDAQRPPENPPATWDAAARVGALNFRAALIAHPNVVPLIVAQVPVGPNALAVREAALAGLVHFGLEARLAARAYTAIAHYVIGFAAQQGPGTPGSTEAAHLADYYRTLDPAQFPQIVATADDLTGVSLDDEFLEGLDFVLAGIGRAVTA